MSIILCEPQCIGFEHAAFNAALLVTTSLSYPDDEIFFFGEQSHLGEIESILTATQTARVHVHWRPIEIAPRGRGGLRNLQAERAFVFAVMAQAQSTPARAVLFCSANEITVLALKQVLRSAAPTLVVRVVLHGVLRSLIEPRWRKPWRWGFSLRQALRFPHPKQLGYIALSQSIRDSAVRAVPPMKACLHAMDMPRLWNPESAPAPPDATRVRFAYFGSAAKGFGAFYQMAQKVKSSHSAADFSLVGFLNGRELQRDYKEEIVSGLARAPISQAEYSRRAAEVHYAVWLADPAHYSLTASASFLDALDFLKPVVYLANPYMDSYFEILGDIGYRCQTLDEMQAVLEELARSFPAERYLQQRENILKGRVLFETSTVAPTLRNILEEGAPCAS